MIATFLAASLTFTATATGVGKGTPLEFVFVGKDSDRDYEAMFIVDEPIAVLCQRMEQAGLPRGRPTDQASCRLWPVGCPLAFDPPLEKFIATTLPEGVVSAPPIYTGGSRTEKGELVAATEMPASIFSLYTLSQSPIVFDGLYDQGVVYGAHLPKSEMKKGSKVAFTVSWDAKAMPRHLVLHITQTNALPVMTALHDRSKECAMDVTVSFDPALSVSAAKSAAEALSLLDSPRIKLNGLADGNLFYRAFLPDVSWTNRTTRLVQPFELTLSDSAETLIFIEEDWNVEGDDPKLTLKPISFAEAGAHKKTDTCFIFASPDCKLDRIFSVMAKLKGTNIRNWYVFSETKP